MSASNKWNKSAATAGACARASGSPSASTRMAPLVASITLPSRTRIRRLIPQLVLLACASRLPCATVAVASDGASREEDAAFHPGRNLRRRRGVMIPGASKRIVGGFEVDGNRYPYSASLQHRGRHFCGGAMIAPDAIITAGHCSGQGLSSSGAEYDVVVGRHDLRRFWTGRRMMVREEVRHPDYRVDTADCDFNVVFLRGGATWGDVKYVKLNNDPEIPAGPSGEKSSGDPLTVVGWGDIDAREDVKLGSDVLMETEIYALTNRECSLASGTFNGPHGEVWTDLDGGITDNMLCAKANGTDACQGDSGGPLIKKGDDEGGSNDLLVGIVSWGVGCADEDFPGVYSRISAQYKWIQAQVCELSADPPDWFGCKGQLGANVLPLTLPPTSQPMTPTPTLPISPAPTRPLLPDGKLRLLIVMQLDDTPGDTGWKLTTLPPDEDEETAIHEVTMGSYSSNDAGNVYEYEVLVDPERFYKLTIFDAHGNGFEGSLSVHEDSVADSTPLAKELGFTSLSGKSVSHGFWVGSSPPWFLTLRFYFHGYAHRIAYELKHDEDGVIMALEWFRTFGEDEETVVVIPVYGPEWPGGDYTMSVWWGNGGYGLFLGAETEENLLWGSGGRFGGWETFRFEVGDPTASPTIDPTPLPTRHPTFPTELSPLSVYYPDYSKPWPESWCINDAPLPSAFRASPRATRGWRGTYGTMLECCKGSFSGQVTGICLSKLQSPPTTSPTMPGGRVDFYYPDYEAIWSEATCKNKAPIPYGRHTYKTMLACCKAEYSDQGTGACLLALSEKPINMTHPSTV